MRTDFFCHQSANHCHIENLQCGKGLMYFASQGIDIGKEENEQKEHRKGGLRTMIHEKNVDGSNVRDLFALISHKLHHQKKGRGIGQGKILNILSSVEQINQKDLQDMLQIQAGSLSEILGKLEKHEWITREKSEEDKRSAIIKITEKGREALQIIEEEHGKHKDIFSVLNQEEKESLKGILEKLRSALGEKEEKSFAHGRCKHRKHRHERY